VTPIRFFTDEDVYGGIATALRSRGFDAVSSPEAGRLGESDEHQLHWAAVNSRTIVTFNVAHFAALHGHWLQHGQHHAGIVVSNQRAFGDLLHRLLNLAATLDAPAMHDRLEFLSDW
jgi:hypothetical protein